MKKVYSVLFIFISFTLLTLSVFIIDYNKNDIANNKHDNEAFDDNSKNNDVEKDDVLTKINYLHLSFDDCGEPIFLDK